jgi:2-iminoacetate synthase
MQLDQLKQKLATSAFKDASIEKVVEKSLKKESVVDEVAALLKFKHILFPELVGKAAELNKELFDKMIEFYAVSYVADLCVNDCSYCGHSSDMEQERDLLVGNEQRLDFLEVLKYGPPDLCILAGEHHFIDADYLARAANRAIEVDHGSLQRITFNVAPMSVEDFGKIRQQVDFPLQFRIFQESYDHETYKQHHHRGPKANFDFRLGAQERALQAGFDNVGIGSLMGLNNDHSEYTNSGNDYEILALVAHAYHLQEQYGAIPYSLSIPRLQKVEGSCFEIPNAVDDLTYVVYHAILKLALPETKLIVTCRETPEMRDILRPLIGIEDFAVKPGVGGNYRETHFQNILGDTRTTPELVNDVREKGYETVVEI